MKGGQILGVSLLENISITSSIDWAPFNFADLQYFIFNCFRCNRNTQTPFLTKVPLISVEAD